MAKYKLNTSGLRVTSFSSFFLDPLLVLFVFVSLFFFFFFFRSTTLSFSLSVLVSFQILNLWSCVYVQISATNGCGHGIWPWDRESWRCLSREWPNWPSFLFHQQQHPWWRRIHHSQSLSFLDVHHHKPPSRWYTCSLPPSLVSTFLGLTHSISLLRSMMVWGFGLLDGYYI